MILSYSTDYAELDSIGAGLTYSYAVTGGNRVYSFTAGTDSIEW